MMVTGVQHTLHYCSLHSKPCLTEAPNPKSLTLQVQNVILSSQSSTQTTLNFNIRMMKLIERWKNIKTWEIMLHSVTSKQKILFFSNNKSRTSSALLSIQHPWMSQTQTDQWLQLNQPHRITSGLNTNFTLSPSYSFHKSSYHMSCFWAYLYSAGTQHGNLHRAGWPVLFCGPTQEPCVSHSQHRKNRERFWKNAGEWTGRVEISKEKIPGSKRSMCGYKMTSRF